MRHFKTGPLKKTTFYIQAYRSVYEKTEGTGNPHLANIRAKYRILEILA